MWNVYVPVFLHRSIDGIFIPHFCSYKYLLKPREGNIFFILFFYDGGQKIQSLFITK